MKNKGFSLIEIILSISISFIFITFVFYFLTTISVYKNKDNQPRLFPDFNYSNTYCQLKNDYKNISIYKDIDLGKYISTSTPITSINIFRKNILIITTNSASTTESDIFLFDIDNMNLIQSINTGPGISDSVLHDNYLYVLNNSVNSHLQTFIIDNMSLNKINDLKIDELSVSYSLPKSIYIVYSDYMKIIVGSEKNNSGGELFIIDTYNNKPTSVSKSINIDGQINDIYSAEDKLYIATAEDNELYVFNIDGDFIYKYNAPLTLGNGKSVYFIYPYILLGRTTSSFELNILSMIDNMITQYNRQGTQGSLDYIEPLIDNILLITNYPLGELLFMNRDFHLLSRVNIPSRVNSYTCLNDSIIVANIISNKSHLLWLK